MATKHKTEPSHLNRSPKHAHNGSATPQRLANGDDLPEPSEALKRVLAKRGDEIKQFREDSKAVHRDALATLNAISDPAMKESVRFD